MSPESFGYLSAGMWSFVLASGLWDAVSELSVKHLTSQWGWGRGGKHCESSCLPDGARKGAVATSPGEAEENSQALPWAHGSQIRTARSPTKEPPTAVPRKLIPGERSLSRLCYYLSKPNKSYFTLSIQGEGLICILINNATLTKCGSINSNKYLSTKVAGARTDTWTSKTWFLDLRGTKSSGPALPNAGPSLLSPLGSYIVPLLWVYIKPSVRPAGVIGMAIEILLKEMSEQWHNEPDPEYSLASLCPPQSLTNTGNGPSISTGMENDQSYLPNILGLNITRWHGRGERAVGQGHVIWVLISGTELWPSSSPCFTSQWGSLHLFLLTPGISLSFL